MPFNYINYDAAKRIKQIFIKKNIMYYNVINAETHYVIIKAKEQIFLKNIVGMNKP